MDDITEDIKDTINLNNDSGTSNEEDMTVKIEVSSGEIPDDEHHSHSHHSHSHHSHSHHSHSHHSHSRHSHGHHSHGHHSHRHHSHHTKRENKFIKFLKKYRKAIIELIVFAVILTSFIFIIAWKESSSKQVQKPLNSVSETSGTVQVETSVYPDEVILTNAAVAEYISSDTDTANAHNTWNKYKGYENRLDSSLPWKFSYKVIGIESGVSVTSAELEISENSSYIDSIKYSLDVKSDSIDIYFLKTGTRYYYRLNLVLSDGAVTGACGSFKTAAEFPRFMNVDGAYNMRDIGGWSTASGKKIKQGLLYRGTEIDGAVESKYCLTETGIEQMTSVLRIKTDMDLRMKSETPGGKDILGDGVKHVYYGAPMYKAIFEESNYECVRKIFSDLADESNYPVYMHCTYGRDRTGTVCYILEALLGLSDADLRREFDISAFTDGADGLESFAGLATMLSIYEGETTQEKAENYLLSIGVTADEIASIRRIFLGE